MFDKEYWRELTQVYNKETSYLLNYYTLHIREPSIEKERLRYNDILFTKIFPAGLLVSAINTCF